MDDAGFHGFGKSMVEFENSEGNVSLTHLGGMISELLPIEYCINGLRKRYNKLPNKTDVESMEAL